MNISIKNIFERDPKQDVLVNCYETWENVYTHAPVLRKISGSKVEDLSLDTFVHEIRIIEDILRFLRETRDLKVERLVELFNRYWIELKKTKHHDWRPMKTNFITSRLLKDRETYELDD